MRLALATVAMIGCGDDGIGPTPDPSAQYGPFASWTPAVRIELAPPGAHQSFNTTATDGCPSVSRDGRTFFMASNRPGSQLLVSASRPTVISPPSTGSPCSDTSFTAPTWVSPSRYSSTLLAVETIWAQR